MKKKKNHFFLKYQKIVTWDLYIFPYFGVFFTISIRKFGGELQNIFEI